MKFQDFSKKLISWYQRDYRPLPWRETSDPYQIWLSEVILQQTKVEQGLPYYKKFVSQYPTIHHLNSANDDEILRLWQGLGYYSRARNLIKCARRIVAENKGFFPESYKELLNLPGIGKYTAAAIASFAFNENVAVVDGNVYRALARIFGITKDISSGSAHEYFKSFSEKLLPKEDPGTYNQALMEFGATICTPKKPKCAACIFNNFCYAYENQAQAQLPVKNKKTKVKDRKFFYVLFYNDQGCLMKRRQGKDIWAGMYDVFWMDTLDLDELSALNEAVSQNIMNDAREIYFSRKIKHVLSHQRLETSFMNVYINNLPDLLTIQEQHLRYYSWEEVAQLPKPVLINNYFTSLSYIT